jgi:hypothetical protein
MTAGAVVAALRSKTSSVGCVLRKSQTASHVSSLILKDITKIHIHKTFVFSDSVRNGKKFLIKIRSKKL